MVFTQISTTALIKINLSCHKCGAYSRRRLFEGGAYLKINLDAAKKSVALVTVRLL